MSFSAHDKVCPVVLGQPEKVVPGSGILSAVCYRRRDEDIRATPTKSCQECKIN